MHRIASLTFLGLLVFSIPGFAQTVAESEPNNTPASANTAKQGETTTGKISFGINEDFDYWKISANAGETIYVDADANEFGSFIDPFLQLFDGDGVTQLASSEDWDGLDPQIIHVAAKSGSYFVRIQAGYGVADQPYTLNFFAITCPVAEDGEDNDVPTEAKVISIGATIHGAACPVSDQDFFSFMATAGAKLVVQVDTTGRERPRFGCACEIETHLALLASDGTTELARTDPQDFLYPTRLRYQATTSGRYYIRVSLSPGGIRYPYTLSLKSEGTEAFGPGDPVLVRADMAEARWITSVVAAAGGAFFASDGGRIWRIAPDGSKAVLAEVPYQTRDIAWDAFGSLLAMTSEPGAAGGLYRISSDGRIAKIINAPNSNGGMAVGWDGSIWVTFGDGNPGPQNRIRHYDPLGRLLNEYDVSTAGVPYHIVIGPLGVPHFSTGRDIYRLASGKPELVLHTSVDGREGDEIRFVFDRDGNIYVSSHSEGRVMLYAPSGATLADLFAWTPETPHGLLFGRKDDGSMNGRLFALDGARLVEMNPAGVRAPGLSVGFRTQATIATAVTDLLRSGGSLAEADRRLLDAIGNQNGRYDAGDLRAFLIWSGALPGAQP
jgi:sugar lactone lactonase YvrE